MGAEGIEPSESGLPLELLIEFDRWKLSACAHENMDHASARIGDWPSVRLFQDALASLGTHAYASLAASIPAANGGAVTPEHAAVCLRELDQFAGERDVIEQFVLRDECSGEIVEAAIARYGGIFRFNGRDHVHAGIDQHGAFFVQHQDGARVFEAIRFEQVMELSEPADPRATLISDRGATYVGTVAFELERRVASERVFASSLRTDVRCLGAEHFGHLVEALRRVFRAAVDVDRPVHWT
jgi:hypothetical protein